MASSDEEGEIIPDSVTNYHFLGGKGEPVSFAVLPLQWKEGEMSEGLVSQIFLRGTADDGLQQIFKKVVLWRFELSHAIPEIYVLLKDNMWIKLKRPRKSYKDMIKPILVTVHFLHFVKKHPEEAGEALWCDIQKTLSSYEVLPSKNDLLNCMSLINEAVSRDKDIAKSKYITTFLFEMTGKRAALDDVSATLPLQENRTPKRPKFIIDDPGDEDSGKDDDSDEDTEQLFDSVCAYCDDGGEILCCEGRCIRSFHPTKESGVESSCESLGYSHEQADAVQTFLCKNCQYQQHQCFKCGLLGSSDKSSGAEVFPCVSATCGRFYHPKCVSNLLYPLDQTQAEELMKKIAEGESFTCPVHKCHHCKQVEDKKVHELQFAICRRCPKAYHRKCLPRNIAFVADIENNVHKRAWDGLLQNRILIYCMDHKIIPKIGTPRRDHLVFPSGDIKGLQDGRDLFSGRRSKNYGSFEEKPIAKANELLNGMHGTVKYVHSIKKVAKGLPKVSVPKQVLMSSKDHHMPVRQKVYKPSTLDKGQSSGIADKSKSLLPLRLPAKMQNIPEGTRKCVPTVKSPGQATMEKRILDLLKSSTASFNQEEFIKEKKRKCFNAKCSKFSMEKTITIGKVEASVKAIRAALKKLDDGGTVEDAKVVCEPAVLTEMIRWKRKLKTYLAPFFHGMRYTSFGRHFTKVDKLKEVVERLRWYVQDGDTIVDFCCGSNDFSLLMKEALDKMGIRCSFKNYDLIQPKNDYSFEKRDWMSVGLEELPAGSNLIMGLNPPFGVQAALANKFINKALRFGPKLLILIVPRETERLDKKRLPYDLIWEDDQLLSGKSFYLPGSVDVHDEQVEQWNIDTPPLSLWSHPRWSAKHRGIAQQHGHVRNYHVVQPAASNYLMEDNYDCYGDFSSIMKDYGNVTNMLDDLPEVSDEFENDKKPDGHEANPVEIQFLQAGDQSMDMELSTP